MDRVKDLGVSDGLGDAFSHRVGLRWGYPRDPENM